MSDGATGVQGRGRGVAGAVVRFAERGRTRVTRTSGARWSEAAETVFLDVLAASCNVTMAAEACGFTTKTIYQRAKRSTAFAARFEAARSQGFWRLEAEVLRTACESMEGLEIDPERPIPRMTVSDAIHLLTLHRRQIDGFERRGGQPRRLRSMDELRAGIVRKIEVIKRARGTPG